jgi:hypothetical protein
MPATISYSKQSGRGFAVIDDGNWRGIIAPKLLLSAKQLAMLIEDLEDTDPKFLKKMHKEYKQAKVDNSFITSCEVEKEIGLK